MHLLLQNGCLQKALGTVRIICNVGGAQTADERVLNLLGESMQVSSVARLMN